MKSYDGKFEPRPCRDELVKVQRQACPRLDRGFPIFKLLEFNLP